MTKKETKKITTKAEQKIPLVVSQNDAYDEEGTAVSLKSEKGCGFKKFKKLKNLSMPLR